jgi:hypothetical protein
LLPQAVQFGAQFGNQLGVLGGQVVALPRFGAQA